MQVPKQSMKYAREQIKKDGETKTWLLDVISSSMKSAAMLFGLVRSVRQLQASLLLLCWLLGAACDV